MIGASLLFGTFFGRIGVRSNKLATILSDVRFGRRADAWSIRSGRCQEIGIIDLRIRVGLKRGVDDLSVPVRFAAIYESESD